MNILYQSDDNYAIYMGVSICSLLENNKDVDEINIFIIDDSISLENHNKIEQMVALYNRKVIFVTGEKVFGNEEISNAFSYAGMRKNTHSYLKLFFNQLLSEVVDRIIYIDCDTAVVGSLSKLYNFDMRDKTIGMVMDSLIIRSKRSIGFEDCDRYFNSGVILIDVNKWRSCDCERRILNHIKNVRTYGTIDQDVLNVELKDEIVTLPMEYNVQPIHIDYSNEMYSTVFKHKELYYSEDEIQRAKESPCIIHYLRYIGESPWNSNNVHPGTVYFDKYLHISPWKDYKKKPSNRGYVFKVEKIMYKYLPPKIFLKIFYWVHERMIAKSNIVRCR